MSDSVNGMNRNDDPKMSGMAWRSTEVQAHMMAAPEPVSERKHVSDAAWEQMCGRFGGHRERAEATHAQMGVVTLTVAEHDELLRSATRLDDSVDFWRDETLKTQALAGQLQAERDALRAEVERLVKENDRLVAECHKAIDDLQERLRQGVKGEHVAQQVDGVDRGCGMDSRSDLRMAADMLDPRLGLPQADGEPVEPMSARPYRRLP